MRVRILAILAAAALLGGACAARADVFGAPRYSYRKTHAAGEWDQSRIVLGGALGLPASFPSGWGSAIGWSVGYLDPLAEYCDLAIDVEGFTFDFDAGDLRARGATVAPVSQASFGDAALGVHLHVPATGRRLYGLVQLALPDVSRPAVSYTDASGSHTQDGSEIFGFDPGWVIGAGIDQVEPRRLGGLIETRFVIAPGRTRNAEFLLSFRAALTVPLPMR